MFHPDRLHAPQHTNLPKSDDPRSRRVFTCSMADLFGKWVPQEWIDAVFAEVRDNPQWEFLFLTKFPQRLASMDWPDNAWVGTTVDRQYRVAIAEKSFRGVKAGVKWLSCEPMLEPLRFSSLEMFDWVVIGGQSASSQEPAFQPPWEWIEDLLGQARRAGCRVYFKENLHNRPQEQPRTALVGERRS
jgi:protein gp37